MRDESQPEINFLGDMQRIHVEPGDIFVLSPPYELSLMQVVRIHYLWKQKMSDYSLLILGADQKLGVISPPRIQEDRSARTRFRLVKSR